MKQLDYALIGNCQISALIDRKGRNVWCCMPRFDSPAIFAALLGEDSNGLWSVLPEESDYETTQAYLRNTNILKTEFRLKSGDAYTMIDFAPRFWRGEGSYRPPELIRILRPMQGTPRIRVFLRPKFDYGRLEPDCSITGGNGLAYRCPEHRLFLETDIPLTYITSQQNFELTTSVYMVLTYGTQFDRPLKFGCEEFLDRTIHYWKGWTKHCNIPFDYQEAVIRSALTLKLHIYEDTGAIVASTTTSIPESGEGMRTWDYRYCWLRDAYFVITALNQLGQFDEMEKFIQYLHNIAASGAELQPVYGVGGEPELPERVLPWLKGWKGYGPVRVGNAAYRYPQYDAYGEMVLAVTPLFFDHRLERVDQKKTFENVIQLVGQAISSFDKTDSGLWEFRNRKDHYLFSKLMSWAAVDRGIHIATKLDKAHDFQGWFEIRNKMRQVIETEGWNAEKGFYSQALGGTTPDASNLLMAALKFHDPKDEKFTQTVENYRRLLMDKEYVFRYRSADDFGRPVHAFTVCTFWMADALRLIGRTAEARSIFEKALSAANHLGLLSEDTDPETGEMWGNFPQTYSHVGVINSAFQFSRSWNEAF